MTSLSSGHVVPNLATANVPSRLMSPSKRPPWPRFPRRRLTTNLPIKMPTTHKVSMLSISLAPSSASQSLPSDCGLGPLRRSHGKQMTTLSSYPWYLPRAWPSGQSSATWEADRSSDYHSSIRRKLLHQRWEDNSCGYTSRSYLLSIWLFVRLCLRVWTPLFDPLP